VAASQRQGEDKGREGKARPPLDQKLQAMSEQLAALTASLSAEQQARLAAETELKSAREEVQLLRRKLEETRPPAQSEAKGDPTTSSPAGYKALRQENESLRSKFSILTELANVGYSESWRPTAAGGKGCEEEAQLISATGA